MLISELIENYIANNLGDYFRESVYSVNGTDYPVLDNDGYTQVWVTTGSTNRTITLPTLVDNQNRIILIGKYDSGTGEVIVDGEGSETIDECTTIQLAKQNNFIKIVALASGWKIIDESIACQLVLNTYAGYGSTDTKIMRFTNKVEGFGNCFSENHTSGYGSNANGLNITINKAGKYAFSYNNKGTTSANNFGLTLNAASLSVSIVSASVLERIAYVTTTNIADSVSAILYLKIGDIIRPHTDGGTPDYSDRCFFTAIYLGK